MEEKAKAKAKATAKVKVGVGAEVGEGVGAEVGAETIYKWKAQLILVSGKGKGKGTDCGGGGGGGGDLPRVMNYYLGLFDSEMSAALAYDCKCLQLGLLDRCNFPVITITITPLRPVPTTVAMTISWYSTRGATRRSNCCWGWGACT